MEQTERTYVMYVRTSSGVLRKIDGAFAHPISWVISFKICQNRKPSMKVEWNGESEGGKKHIKTTYGWKARKFVITVYSLICFNHIAGLGKR